MKSTLKHIVCAGVIICGSAGQRAYSQNDISFATPQEAANQAKTHLLAVMQLQKQMALGVEAAAIEKSRPGRPLKRFQITFDELLSTDSFAKVTGNELTTVVPLVADNKVVTTVEVAKDEKGWRIAALADKAMADELNAIQKATADPSEVVIYDLPHTHHKVYAVTRKDGGETAGPTLRY